MAAERSARPFAALFILLLGTGYVVSARSLAEDQHSHADGHDHDHDHSHENDVEKQTGLREDIPDCKCVVPFPNCQGGGRAAAAALATLSANKCADGDTCRTMSACQSAFFSLTALHNGCADGSVASDQEIEFHMYEKACKSCYIEETFMPTSHNCPEVDCSDHEPMEMAYDFLLANCSGICDTDATCSVMWHQASSYHEICRNTHDDYDELFHIWEINCPDPCVVHDEEHPADCDSDINKLFAANSTTEFDMDVVG